MENRCKTILLGDTNVGKTAIVERYMHDSFNADLLNPTICADVSSRTSSCDGVCMELEIWDTAGLEEYRSLTPHYYQNADVALVVFSFDLPSSLDDAQSWIDDVREKAATDPVIVLVGNKLDVESRAVSDETAQALAEKNNICFFKTSALTGHGIEAVFEFAASRFLEKAARESEACRVEEPEKTKCCDW